MKEELDQMIWQAKVLMKELERLNAEIRKRCLDCGRIKLATVCICSKESR